MGASTIISSIEAIIDRETGGLTRGMDYVNRDLLGLASDEELREVVAWSSGPRGTRWVARFVGGSATALLRARAEATPR
jgi:hypothetical protein